MIFDGPTFIDQLPVPSKPSAQSITFAYNYRELIIGNKFKKSSEFLKELELHLMDLMRSPNFIPSRQSFMEMLCKDYGKIKLINMRKSFSHYGVSDVLVAINLINNHNLNFEKLFEEDVILTNCVYNFISY